MNPLSFPTDYDAVRARLNHFDAGSTYQRSRNNLDGNVSMLSPYITHGVLPLPTVFEHVIAHYGLDAYKFLQELTWREFFQRVWWNLGDDIFDDVRRPQPDVTHSQGVPAAILDAETGIAAVDEQIRQLYNTGYVHNHARMYIASLVCNFGHFSWKKPAQWFYANLLDGDPASNTLNWQWVSGVFSHKTYIFNQSNVNKYAAEVQHDTWLDVSYESIKAGDVNIPDGLQRSTDWHIETKLPTSDKIDIGEDENALLYHPFHLDPSWRTDERAQRILVLEPSHFERFPVAEHVMRFILDLAKNITDIKIFSGEVGDLPGLANANTVKTKSHPAFRHFPGKQDDPDIYFTQVPDADVGLVFTPYWKNHCLPILKQTCDTGE